jgi:hypothetical protein
MSTTLTLFAVVPIVSGLIELRITLECFIRSAENEAKTVKFGNEAQYMKIVQRILPS